MVDRTAASAGEQDHTRFMELALAASYQALPGCRPNPPVGCVLVREGTVVGSGFTQPPYLPHAEAMAMGALVGDLSAVTAYVTLEPCSFAQRTPSCAQTLISRRIGAVFVAVLDPDPRNQGRGIQLLQEAGIPVHLGALSAEVTHFLGPYLTVSHPSQE